MLEESRQRHAQELADGKHDAQCEWRERSMLCHCPKRRREAAGFTKAEDLIWIYPDCPHCNESVNSDGDTWYCENCSISWGEDGRDGEFNDDYGDLSEVPGA